MLPTSGSNGSVITWTSSDADVIAAGGTVTRGESDIEVTLTATVSLDGATDNKTFTVLVPELVPEGGKVTFYDTATGEAISVLTDAETQLTVKADVKLVPPYTGSASLIIARYTNDGTLMSVVVDNVSLTKGEIFSYDTGTINSSRADSIKVMIWDDMEPLLLNNYYIGR